MKNIFKKYVASILLVSAVLTATAQQNFPINLETVLKLAGANNLTVQEYQLRYQQALAEQSKAKEWWLPNIYAGATTHYLNGAAMNTEGPISTDVNRNYLWAGIGIGAEIDFNKGFYYSLVAKQEADAMKYQSQAERNNSILKIIAVYYNLLTEQYKYAALQQLINESDTLAKQIKIQVDAGLRYQSEYLLAQSNYNHLRIFLLQTKTKWEELSAELANLLNLEANVLLAGSETSIIPLNFSVDIPDTSSQKTIFEKRPEYMSLQSSIFSLQTQRKTATTGLLFPKFRLSTDDALFGKIQSPYYNTYQLNAALVWQLPLGRFTYNGDIKQFDAKILIRQNEMEQIKNLAQEELSKASAQLQSAKKQLNIAEEALELSAQALQQSMERQMLGTVMPFEVFQAQQFFLQAQTDNLKAIVEYNKVQYRLFVAMGNNL